MFPEVLFASNGFNKIVTPNKAVVGYFRQGAQGCDTIMEIDYHDTAAVSREEIEKLTIAVERFLKENNIENFRLLYVVDTYSPYIVTDFMTGIDNYFVYDTYEEKLHIQNESSGQFKEIYDMMENYVSYGEISGAVSRESIVSIGRKTLYRINTLLILINVLAFIWLEIQGDTTNARFLREHGGLFLQDMELYGEWYRLLSSMFIHAGFSHLINNMIVLFCLGEIIERVFGKRKYVALYLLSGIVANIVSCFYYNSIGEYIVSCGASGAIFGVAGALLFIVIVNHGKFEGLTIKRMILFMVMSIYTGLMDPNVNFVAHFAGMIAGFFLAAILYRRQTNN